MEDCSLIGSIANEEVANINAALPEIPANECDLAFLLNIMSIDFKLLRGNADLDMVGFDGREHEHCDDSSIAGPQSRAFAERHTHSKPFYPRDRFKFLCSYKIQALPYERRGFGELTW